MLAEKIAEQSEIEALEQQAKDEVQQAIEFANESDLPKAEDVMNYIFAEA